MTVDSLKKENFYFGSHVLTSESEANPEEFLGHYSATDIFIDSGKAALNTFHLGATVHKFLS